MRGQPILLLILIRGYNSYIWSAFCYLFSISTIDARNTCFTQQKNVSHYSTKRLFLHKLMLRYLMVER